VKDACTLLGLGDATEQGHKEANLSWVQFVVGDSSLNDAERQAMLENKLSIFYLTMDDVRELLSHRV
jgi:hypothetical protein